MNPNRWIRLYKDSLHNPKIVSLSDRQHRIWHNLLLIADDTGMLPATRDIACHLRMSMQDAEQALHELMEAGLVDPNVMGPGSRRFRMHDWETHQYVSDTSTDRVRKFRNKNKEANDETLHETPRNVSVTPPDTEADSETDTDTESKHAREVKFENRFFGKDGRAVSALLKRRAEGLGLNVVALEARALAKEVRIPNAMFKKLVADKLREDNPIISETLIKAALTKGNDAAWGQLQAMLVGAV